MSRGTNYSISNSQKTSGRTKTSILRDNVLRSSVSMKKVRAFRGTEVVNLGDAVQNEQAKASLDKIPNCRAYDNITSRGLSSDVPLSLFLRPINAIVATVSRTFSPFSFSRFPGDETWCVSTRVYIYRRDEPIYNWVCCWESNCSTCSNSRCRLKFWRYIIISVKFISAVSLLRYCTATLNGKQRNNRAFLWFSRSQVKVTFISSIWRYTLVYA